MSLKPHPDPKRLMEQFIDAWNVPGEDERRRLIESTCTERTVVSSPYGEQRGISEQIASIVEVRKQYPQIHCQATLLSAHDNWVLVAWETDFGSARPKLTGIDVYQLDRIGRIARVTSFSPVPNPSPRADLGS